MSNNKTLSSSVILKAYSNEFVQKQVTVNINGEDYDVLVDKKFKNTKIDKLIKELLNNFDDYKELDKTVCGLYISFLTIKHFTSLDVIETNSFAEQISLLNSMIDLDIYNKIISEFEISEIEKINTSMINFASNIDEFMKDEKNVNILKSMMENNIGEDVGGKNVLDSENIELEVANENIDVNEEIINIEVEGVNKK